ncbi:MAG: acyl carrier protein [Acutalibacteraceae bacterium]|nr:acyl carrier protein [Acutalibacteraceae bacterium]
MEELKNLLKNMYPNIDFDNEENLYDDGIIDSVDVVSIISKLEEAFDISVTMEYIQPSYFQSVDTIWEMVEELM